MAQALSDAASAFGDIGHGRPDLRLLGVAAVRAVRAARRGRERDLFFDDDVSNAALVELRRFVIGFIQNAEPDTPQVFQWERDIEL